MDNWLDEILFDPQTYYVQDPDTGAFCVYDVNALLQLKIPEILDHIKEALGDMEYQETADMTLKSWTPQNYKVFGRNELRIEIKSKLGIK
jgi:hypothetical protein